jgi:hypothetical protein
MVNLCGEIFLFCLVLTVLTFFIAGLLYLLRFERVDNLGAYSIPPETGLLIPSVGDNSIRFTFSLNQSCYSFSRELEINPQGTCRFPRFIAHLCLQCSATFPGLERYMENESLKGQLSGPGFYCLDFCGR